MDSPLARIFRRLRSHRREEVDGLRSMNLLSKSAFAVSLGAALLLLISLASMQAAVRFDVFLGYDGILPEASWFPVSFEVQNDGAPFTAVVEIAPGQFNQNQTRLMTVELPTGTMKRFVIPVFSASRFTYNWSARLLDERGKVRAETIGLRTRKQNQWRIPLAGAVSRTSGGVP